MEKDKDQANDVVNVENENSDDELRRQVAELEQKLQLASEERNREKDRANAREREMDALSNTLRRQEHTAAIERDVLVRDYQGRINELVNNRVTPGMIPSETRSNDGISTIRVTVPGQTSDDQNGRNSGNRSGQNTSVRHSNGNYEVPMPRQALFDGKTSWESFFQPFEALAQACKWDKNEKVISAYQLLKG